MQLIREAKRTITELPNNPIPEQVTNKNSINNASIHINPNDTHHNSNNQNSTSNENDLRNNQSITDNSNSNAVNDEHTNNHYPPVKPLPDLNLNNTIDDETDDTSNHNPLIITEHNSNPNNSINETVDTNNKTNDTQSTITDLVKSRPEVKALNSLKSGMVVQYQDWEGYPFHDATITKRAGKASGKNKHFWNTVRTNGSDHVVDFSKVHNLKPLSPSQTNISDHQENIPDAVMLAVNKTNEMNAKFAELNQWKSMGVYRELSDQGRSVSHSDGLSRIN